MYTTDIRFNTLSTEDSPKTRVRIYFIGDGVDCTDDNDVQTNGTLLVGAVGDTDSNGRISESGIRFTQMFGKEKNFASGECASYEIEMNLLNHDGALDGFTFGRCKVYLDVYDSTNSVWKNCPMGVYIIEQPTQTQLQLVSVHGFDQMQKLDAIADDWWNGIDFTGGLTWKDIVTSMATYLGYTAIPDQRQTGGNETIAYSAAPFECIEKTYKDVLKWIGEFSGQNALFDRDGNLVTRSFFTPRTFPDSNYVIIDTDTIGNQCLEIQIGSYTVEQTESFTIKVAADSVDVTASTGEPNYTVFDNPMFTHGASNDPGILDNVSQRAWSTLFALQEIPDYVPIQGRFIWNWAIDAGDIIYITRKGVNYALPIFQQTMLWRGGYVVANVLSYDEKIIPVRTEKERESYQLNERLTNYVPSSGGTYTGNVTFNGLVDITQRRCSAALSSVGWYRVFIGSYGTTGAANGSLGTITRFNIVKQGSSNLAESHSITCRVGNQGSVVWMDEESYSAASTLIIDKIRLVADGTKAYFDIHYNSSDANNTSVYFDAYVYRSVQAQITSGNFASVPDSPSGTVLSEYSFNKNGTGDLNVNGTVTGQGFADLLFGIGNTIASNTDCDTIQTEGKYTCPTSVVGSTLSNAPYTSAFGMLVLRVAESTRLIQVAMPNSNTITVKIRYFNGTSWTAWKTLTPA